ncbi:CLUMA_CG000780, isoform A [Clunio marinus]|uniref:CLUMA_CG000780, isoform A n=1 Tax=Clunio marinus TaxID=568069 RepID=A0A1J1HHS2_9DIPT|nr:CLUMA_CG000780, isoform A [Clunio marinus]
MMQTSYIRGKDVFETVVPLCRQHYGIIKQVFSSPDQVISKFILNIYQLRIHQFVSTKLTDDSKDDAKYLKTLHYLYLRTMKLSNDLSEFIKDSNDDLLSKLTQNMFSKHLATYIDTELFFFDKTCSMEVRKFYDSKNHQKKQTERFQDLKRDMQAIISARTNINIVQIDNYGGETFLSEELAINLLQESTAAFDRCSVLSKEAETPTNIIKLADILLKYLITEHCDYAVDLGIQSIPIADTKSAPQIYFFDVVQKTNTIIHLMEKTYNASILPYVISTSKYVDCMHKKRFCLESIENKLDNGLDRSLNSICNWMKIYLQSEQKKTDFKPESDIDTVASSACSAVCQHINSCIARIKKTIDGENLVEVLQELGVRFHRVIYEHLLQYQYNTLGAMVAICDVNEYRKCVRKLGDSLVSQLFDILHALCNLLLVKHENLQEVCSGETLNYLDKSVVMNFIQLRSDYKTIKQVTASLKTYN